MWIYLVTRLHFHHPASPPSTALNWTTLSAVGGTKRDRWERASLRIFAAALLIAFFSDTFWQIYRPPTPLRWSNLILEKKEQTRSFHCLSIRKFINFTLGLETEMIKCLWGATWAPKKAGGQRRWDIETSNDIEFVLLYSAPGVDLLEAGSSESWNLYSLPDLRLPPMRCYCIVSLCICILVCICASTPARLFALLSLNLW